MNTELLSHEAAFSGITRAIDWKKRVYKMIAAEETFAQIREQVRAKANRTKQIIWVTGALLLGVLIFLTPAGYELYGLVGTLAVLAIAYQVRKLPGDAVNKLKHEYLLPDYLLETSQGSMKTTFSNPEGPIKRAQRMLAMNDRRDCVGVLLDAKADVTASTTAYYDRIYLYRKMQNEYLMISRVFVDGMRVGVEVVPIVIENAYTIPVLHQFGHSSALILEIGNGSKVRIPLPPDVAKSNAVGGIVQTHYSGKRDLGIKIGTVKRKNDQANGSKVLQTKQPRATGLFLLQFLLHYVHYRAKNLFFYWEIIYPMLNFFYDSLDTLKKVKQPTRKEIINLTGVIFAVVIISALVFALMDGVFGGIYKEFYTMMTGA